ncbi:MAG: translation initiation factor eIF-1A [Candidatus Thermoplasmatota archaeon]|nr:translation initiation factor eIF-1A [Candidatus Thermoplasmatota archaeon]MDI6855456.1 translation initiation factor eIF-1A [Candidatus Thermoplasmatota archaeon]
MKRRMAEVEEAEELGKLQLPKKGELFAIADRLFGGSRIKVICSDGKSRLARIPGKLKKKLWVRAGDLVIIKPWEFQNEKADIVWRYTRTQAVHLSKKGMLPKDLDIFSY